MMRILRIGEHAARAVRTAVEKVLLTSSAARNQSIRRWHVVKVDARPTLRKYISSVCLTRNHAITDCN